MYYEIELKVWLRSINCILIIIIMYSKTYRENIKLQYICFAETILCEKNHLCHPNLLKVCAKQ